MFSIHHLSPPPCPTVPIPVPAHPLTSQCFGGVLIIARALFLPFALTAAPLWLTAFLCVVEHPRATIQFAYCAHGILETWTWLEKK